jgi:hypothetical protein
MCRRRIKLGGLENVIEFMNDQHHSRYLLTGKPVQEQVGIGIDPRSSDDIIYKSKEQLESPHLPTPSWDIRSFASLMCEVSTILFFLCLIVVCVSRSPN